jgi:streptogramin lyase
MLKLRPPSFLESTTTMKNASPGQSSSRCITAFAAVVALGLNTATGATKVYTTDADFDLGVLFNVNHTAPNNNQLQLNTQSATFPVLWVANAGEDTVSKIDTNTGKETARYRTWFNGAPNFSHLNDAFSGPAPSRTAVDSDGNCYVANRHFSGNRPAEVMKIFASGGIDRNGNGVIDTSVDTNNNGVIDPSEIMGLVDSTVNGIVDPSEIQDERVAWIVRVGPGAGWGRSLTIDPSGFIWVGIHNAQAYYKLDPTTGAILAGPIATPGHTPYGAVVDATGTLWGASLSNNLLKLNTNTNAFVQLFTHSGSNYAIGFGNGRVYLGNASPVRDFNPATNTFTNINAGFGAYGVSVASNGELLVHGSTASGSNGGATRFRTDGSIVWSRPNQAGAADFNGRGCVPDANGDVWTVNLGTHNVSKYRGSDGAPLGVFPVGNSPYSYSDATGSTFVQTIGLGRWTVVYDTNSITTDDVLISWNANVPGASSLTVRTAASNTKATPGDYSQGDFVAVTNGGTASLTGRYQAVQVTMVADPNNSQSPVLFDLTIAAPAPCGPLDVNGNGCVDTTDLNLVTAAVRARSTDLKYDVNCDGRVDILDSRFLATKFTNPGGAPCVAPTAQ